MRKQLIAMVILPLTICNCHEKTKIETSDENVLLAKEVLVTSSVVIDNQLIPEWTSGINCDELFKHTFEQVLSKKVTVYAVTAMEFGDVENKTAYPVDKIDERMDWQDSVQDYSQLKEIRFYENWDFNGSSLKFEKEVIAWCPIRVYERNDGVLKKMIFFVYPEKNNKGKSIAQRIYSEFPWEIEYPNIDVGFDKSGFLEFIIQGINSGDFAAYDPIYMVDGSKRKFTSKELAIYINEELNPGIIASKMGSILFEEDWYFDEKTLSIQKDVKSFAFVQDRYDEEKGESKKKILFFIFPN